MEEPGYEVYRTIDKTAELEKLWECARLLIELTRHQVDTKVGMHQMITAPSQQATIWDAVIRTISG